MRRALVPAGVAAFFTIGGCFLSLKEYPLAAETGGSGGTGPGSGSGGGSAGSGATATAAAFSERCDADRPCEEGLLCWEETATPWGPAGGICTKPCTKPDDCPGTAYCVGAIGYCFEGCSLGDANPNKCVGRRDLGCGRVDPMQGIDACIPACSDDDDCSASGRICDRGKGMCVVGTHEGKAAGEPCTSSAECRGLCEVLCGELCVVGAPKACDQTAVSSTVFADCIGSAFSDTGIQEKVGDLAFCARRCRCPTDCPGDLVDCATIDGDTSGPHCIVPARNTMGTLCPTGQ